MKNSILVSALAFALCLSACDKTPVVVQVPAETVLVPGPAGPAGKPGEQGADGNKGDTGVKGNTGDNGVQGTQGDTGQAGENTTVIIAPPAAEPTTTN